MANRLLDGIAKGSIVFAGFIILVVSCVVATGALSRYIFSAPLAWMEEFAGSMMIPIFFLPLLYVLTKDRHIKIKLLTDHLPVKARSFLLLTSSLLALAYAGFVTYEGLRLVQKLIHYNANYVMIAAPQAVSAVLIPVGMGIFGLGCLALLIKQIRALVSKCDEPAGGE